MADSGQSEGPAPDTLDETLPAKFEEEVRYVLAKAQKPSFVLSPDREGGKYLFVDFAGDTMSYVDIETGEDVR